MSITRKEMMSILSNKYPTLFMRTYEEFKGLPIEDDGGIWSSGEGCEVADDGLLLFNNEFDSYFEDEFGNIGVLNLYEFGVHNELNGILEENGWYAEWYDCGTIMFCKQ